MSRTAKISYNGFYDVPLAFVVWHRNTQLLFWRGFDDSLDDYSGAYDVFVLPNLSDGEISRSWGRLPEMATSHLGEVPVSDVIFDGTKRQEIGINLLDTLLAPSEAVNV